MNKSIHPDSSMFFELLQKHQLPAVSHKTYLVCRSILYAAIERQISQSTDIGIRRIWGPDCFKLSWLLKYMQSMGVAKSPVIEPAVRMTLQLAGELLTQGSEGESSMLLSGYLYALESFQANGKSSMKELLRRMSLVSLAQEDERLFISSSETAGIALGKISTALFPYSEDQLKFHICSVNPEAGSHATPQDPLEIEVALRAGTRSFRRFSYLKERYGERGERFTASDSCWLVALIPLEGEVIRKSISWLRTVLAKRGLPSVILECHMADIIQLYRELIPQRQDRLESFSKVAAALKVERHRAVGKEPPCQSQGAALLASARADEMAGIRGAFEAVQSWFADPARAISKRAA